MAPDRLGLVMALSAPLAALAMYQGLVTAGMAPLALFGPVYVVARALSRDSDRARVTATRLAAGSAIGAGLALGPAILFLGTGSQPLPVELQRAGVLVLGAGIGTLAGLATAPEPRPLTHTEARRWTLVETLDHEDARGLALLSVVALPAGILLGLLREAPVVPGADGSARSIVGALFGDQLVDGALVLPDPTASIVLAIPITLAPVAVGFLTSPRRATPVLAGGVAAFLLAGLTVLFDLPVETAAGGFVPVSVFEQPGLAAGRVVAPIGAGLLLGAGVVYVLDRLGRTRVVRRSLWALLGAGVAVLTHGWLAASALLLGVAVASVVLSWRTRQAPLGASLAAGALVGLLVAQAAPVGPALFTGAFVGLVAGAAVVAATTTRTLPLPTESIRSNKTLWIVLVMALGAGAVSWYATVHLAGAGSPFPAPHARALSSSVDALVTGDGGVFLAWGLAAGILVQWLLGRGALVAIGVLVGPGVAGLVAVGALGRAWWENRLLERAREGYIMRGELGYELLRVHALVVAVLVGEALATGLAGFLAP